MTEGTYVRRTRSTMRRGERSFGPWDRPHLLLWGGLLLLLVLTPMMSMGGATIWTWDVFGGDAAQHFVTPDPDAPWVQEGPGWDDIINTLFPHLYGALALALLYLCRPTRLRGQVLVGVGVAYFALNLTGARLSAMLPMRDMNVAGWSLLLGLLVGPPLLAAGNRVQRREEVTGPPLILAIVGGLMVVLPFFTKVMDHFVFEVFFASEAWGEFPLMLLLLFAWFCLGMVGVSLALPGIRRTRGVLISRLLRVCLWAAPIIIIITVMGQLAKLPGSSSGAVAWAMLRMYLLFAGILVLIAVGLARILEGPEPEDAGDIEDAVKAF